MKFPEKRKLSWVLQIIVTVIALYLILRSVDLRAIPALIISADPSNIILALVFALLHFAVGAWRWQQLIFVTNLHWVPWRQLFNSYLVSFFVSSLLPGTITGDIVRIYDTRQESGGSAKSALIVFVERLLGLFVLVILGGFAWLSLDQRPQFNFYLPQWLLPVIALAGVAGLILWRFDTIHNKLFKHVTQWFRVLLSTTQAFPGLIYQNPSGFLRVLAGTILYQLLGLLIVYQGLLAAHVPVQLATFLAIAPLVTLIIMLPISVQGIGLRESLYISLLVPFGASTESVFVGLSLTYLFGLPFILWGWLLYSQRANIAVQKI